MFLCQATHMNAANSVLTARQWIVVVLLAGPPLASVLFNVGPGRWINSAQDAVIGGHSLELSVLAVLLLEVGLLWVVAVGVRWLTGRTLAELSRQKKPDQTDTGVSTTQPQPPGR